MILSLEQRVVLLTPPKCATVTLHDVFGRAGCQCVLGPQFDGGVGEHTTMLPWDVWSIIDEFTFAVVTRHPYTRTQSMYGHYRRYWPSPHLDFTEFLERIVVAPRYLFFNATISSFLAPLEDPMDGHPPVQVTEAVRVESLIADLGRLGLNVPDALPEHHRSDGAGTPSHTRATKRLVDLWARHDFDRFGYSPRP